METQCVYDSVSTGTYYVGVVKSFPDGEGKEEGDIMFTDPTYPVVVLEPPPDLVVVHLVERGDITSTQASHRSLREGCSQLHLHQVTVRFVSLYDWVSTSTYYGWVVKSFPVMRKERKKGVV